MKFKVLMARSKDALIQDCDEIAYVNANGYVDAAIIAESKSPIRYAIHVYQVLDGSLYERE